MKRSTQRQLTPQYPGYADDVKSPRDFAKCGVERRMAILNSLTRLMEMYTRNLGRADERLAEAAKVAERERAEIADEKAFLANIMAIYLGFAQVIAADAASAIEARRAETTGSSCESAVGSEASETPVTSPTP